MMSDTCSIHYVSPQQPLFPCEQLVTSAFFIHSLPSKSSYSDQSPHEQVGTLDYFIIGNTLVDPRPISSFSIYHSTDGSKCEEIEMEFMKLVDDKGSSKMDLYFLRTRINQKSLMRYNFHESTGQAHCGGGMAGCVNENGRFRMRILVRSHELKHLMDVMKNAHEVESSPNSSSTLEQRLQFKRWRHFRRADSMKKRCCPWRPVLQSIPEEL